MSLLPIASARDQGHTSRALTYLSEDAAVLFNTKKKYFITRRVPSSQQYVLCNVLQFCRVL